MTYNPRLDLIDDRENVNLLLDQVGGKSDGVLLREGRSENRADKRKSGNDDRSKTHPDNS